MSPSAQEPLSVSAFLAQINALLETQVAWVEGEVASFHVVRGKNAYFDLKDTQAVLPCYAPAYRLRTPLEDGMRVRVWGVPSVYAPYGKFSLNVHLVEPTGEGALRRAFELLRQQLAREGLFDPTRKRPLPRIPEQVVLLTSADAAAYDDVVKVLAGRRGGMDILFLPVSVQGHTAVGSIVRAIDWANEEHPEREVLVLVRGGGNLEELRAFNDERVVRALARSRIPTLVGVGHERDVTLSDFVADVRAATPSNAAELLTPTRAELDLELAGLRSRLTRAIGGAMRARLDQAAHAVVALREMVRGPLIRLQVLSKSVARQGALLRSRVQNLYHAIDGSTVRLRGNVRQALESDAARVAALLRLLSGLHPEHTLRRGYSITRGPNGLVVRAARAMGRGDQLTTTLHQGSLDSTVTSVHP